MKSLESVCAIQRWHIPQADVLVKRAEIRYLRSLGGERYECPMLFADKEDNVSKDLQASFAKVSPDISKRVDTFDIVATFSDWVQHTPVRFKQRSAKGHLRLGSHYIPEIGR